VSRDRTTTEVGVSRETKSMAVRTSLDFKPFKRAVAAQLERMRPHGLYVAQVRGDVLWERYLASFPAGADPIYEKRTEHDCSCCRSFVKRAGAIVALVDGKPETIWDFTAEVDPAYRVVADSLSALVRAADVAGPLMSYEATIGTEKSFDQVIGKVVSYEHFFARVPAVCVVPKPPKTKKKLKLPTDPPEPDSIESKRDEERAAKDVLLRSLREITMDAVDTVLDLISQNSLYRGEENMYAVKCFQELKLAFSKVPPELHDWFAWTKSAVALGSVSRIRNTAIGTLLVDLSQGKDVDEAVRAFEVVVAPANYKRPTALVTKAQVAKAREAIAALGLTSALERRHARLSDISVADLLFADRDSVLAVAPDVFDGIAKAKKPSYNKLEEVPVEKFLSDVLPRAKALEVLLENGHAGNFVSLVAPVDFTSQRLFKWGNGFSWSYAGDVADSIKERVKKAGGNVTGELCCRLAWDYTDDLDFHMHEPSGHSINFSTYRRHKSPSGGELDLDANGADGHRDDPAENIFYERISTMRDGAYTLEVHNFARRSAGVGFEVEIDVLGEIHRFAYDKVLRLKDTVTVAVVHVKHGVVTVEPKLPSTTVGKEVWGVKTNEFHRVQAVMLSPNHWGERPVGNKHYIFALRGCVAPDGARGFYNEFLREELTPHRKTLEIVGSKVRAEPSEHQVSGLGFSSTQRNSLVCRVGGAVTRVVRVTF